MRPFWLERQTDVSGPDFVPGQSGRPPANITHRSWTMVGTVASLDRGVVDPRGLVTPSSPPARAGDPVDAPGAAGAPGGWSLDWWVGADDRWHTPATDAGVRQRLLGDAPVVETAVRIPGGDAVQRVYAIHTRGASPAGRTLIVVEIENQSPVPFALALAVLPFHPLGGGHVGSVALDDTTLLVNGAPGVLLPKRPAHAAATAGPVDAVVLGGGAPTSFDDLVAPDGDGQAALVFPLPHTAVLRVALPVGSAPAPRVTRATGRARRASAEPVTYPGGMPSAEQVAKGWEVQTRRGTRLVLPDATLQAAVDAGRRMLLVAHGGEDLASWPDRPLDWVAAASVLGALDRFGFTDEVEQVLATLPERQALDGSLVGADGSAAANGAALGALGEHWRLTRDVDLLGALVGPIAKAVHWIDKRRSARRSRPPMTADELAWSVAGLRGIADALDGTGQPEVAADARRIADGADADRRALPSGPVELAGVAVIDPVARAGLSPSATLALAAEELAAGDATALHRLAWVVSVASPTWVWPEVVHPRTGGGSRGDGHHTPTGADLLTFVRRLLVRETADGLALTSVVPPTWLGSGFEVHDAPTAWGRLSYAVRWHGPRPALLWELEPHAGAEPPRLTAPGLDPGWSSGTVRGEALLAEPVRGVPDVSEPADAPPVTDGSGAGRTEPGASFS